MKKSWVTHLAFSNLKKHRKRNIFSIISLVIGLTASFLIIGFSNNATKSIQEECYNQFDYGNMTITKEIRTESKNGGLSIVRNIRPSKEEILSISNKLQDFEIDINLESVVSSFPIVSYKKNELKEYSYEGVYSFFESYTNNELLIEGEYPSDDTLDYVLINETAEKNFKKKYKISPVGLPFNIHYECEYEYYTDDEYQPVINDYFTYDKNVVITGVVRDLSFLSTPKIYYSYIALRDYLSSVYLNNLSLYLERDYSWVERITDSNNSDPVNAYTYRLFLKKHQDVSLVEERLKDIEEPFVINHNAKVRSDALLTLIMAASTGMEVFLFISLFGTALIMGIISFSYYSEDKKNIATLVCLGARLDDVNDIYCMENILIGIISFIISIVLAPLLELLINYIVGSFTRFHNIIKIPIMRFMNIPFGLIIIVFISTLMVAILSTMLPILFSKKISLKEELKDE